MKLFSRSRGAIAPSCPRRSPSALRSTLAATLALLVTTTAATAPAATLVVNSNASDPAPRKAMDELAAMFRKENPDVDLKVNTFDHESFKTSIRNWLSSASPDVVFWFSGIRMQQFVDLNLFADISPVFTPELKQQLGSTLGSVTVKDKQYGVPYSYYQWGFYYRKDLFQQVGVNEPPKTWTEYLDACAKLKAANIIPVAIGTKQLWPAAGWFDYLNLRINGLDFHRELLAGKVPYTDPRVKAVFTKWDEMVKPGYYLPTHASSTWQEAQAFLYQGKAAMYLIGNFIVPNFPPDLKDKMGFFPFPEITPGLPRFEDAPTESVHVPTKAKNKADAMKFMAFMARPDVQKIINEALVQIPPNSAAGVKDDPFLQAGLQSLSTSAGQAQFFDRDTSETFATVGMKSFQEFMLHPDRVDAILAELDKARVRSFKDVAKTAKN